ncbi:putative transporter [Thozetella sp. PMI_491]|nr:putative transporter [Thozetella sp. PMI_491]
MANIISPSSAGKVEVPVEEVERTGDTKLDDVALEAAARGQTTTGYESLTVWETIRAFKIATLICFAAAFSAATDGYQIGMNGSIVANQGFINQFATERNGSGTLYLASPVLSGWASIMSVGQIVGMTTLPFVTSRFGRKPAMFTYWFVMALSVMVESLSRSWEHWLIGKLLAGIGVGCMQHTLPTYISEIAPVRIRGTMLMCYSLWWTTGSFFAYIGLQTMAREHATNYLTPIYTQFAQVGLMLIIYLIIPESPAWCVGRGKEEKARKQLQKIYWGVKDFNIDQHLQSLCLTVEHERTVAAEQRGEQWYAIFRGVDGRRTLVALWTLLTQQFIGLALFGTFGTYFFQQAGLPDPFKIKCIVSGINIAATIVYINVADFIGRRWLACLSTTLSWVSCIAIGILGVSPQVQATQIIFVLFACLWNIGMTGNGATGWGFIGEISSQRLRPYTAGFGAATTCVAGVVMAQVTPYMVNANQWNWGFKTGWFYAGVGLPFTLGMWFLIPETAGRSAAELDELFERKIPAWRFHKTETATQRLIKVEKTGVEKAEA